MQALSAAGGLDLARDGRTDVVVLVLAHAAWPCATLSCTDASDGSRANARGSLYGREQPGTNR